jgi:uncharacterized protein
MKTVSWLRRAGPRQQRRRQRAVVLVVGCSVRAAAGSVRRMGGHPVGVDQFADLDLRAQAYVVAVREYPASLVENVSRWWTIWQQRGPRPLTAWFACGGLEHHIETCTAISSLVGPSVADWGSRPGPRDVVALQEVAADEGFPALATERVLHEFSAAQPRNDLGESGNGESERGEVDTRRWMEKPIASGGGIGLREWSCGQERRPKTYLQQRADGVPCSALFRVSFSYGAVSGDGSEFLGVGGDVSSAISMSRIHSGPSGLPHVQVQFLGATQQLVGEPCSQPPSDYAYCGNVGPLWLPDDWIRRMVQMVLRLQPTAGLRGLVGLDFLWGPDGLPRFLEWNPRYTGGVEVLELATKTSLLRSPNQVARSGLHEPSAGVHDPSAYPFGENRSPPRCFFGSDYGSENDCGAGSTRPMVGKLILYTSDAVRVPDWSRWAVCRDLWRVPFLADLPRPGSVCSPGFPVCTVFATGRDGRQVTSRLRERATVVHSWLRRGGSGVGGHDFTIQT